jgi:hypothetical protein
MPYVTSRSVCLQVYIHMYICLQYTYKFAEHIHMFTCCVYMFVFCDFISVICYAVVAPTASFWGCSRHAPPCGGGDALLRASLARTLCSQVPDTPSFRPASCCCKVRIDGNNYAATCAVSWLLAAAAAAALLCIPLHQSHVKRKTPRWL